MNKSITVPMTEYEKGEWDMFELITSMEYGKQRFFLGDNGMAYDRDSNEHMTIEQAYEKYFDEVNAKMGEIY